ncbi:MAG TPA: hypothetical protein VGB30_13070 [bacterium]|jgi:hypothetical protein
MKTKFSHLMIIRQALIVFILLIGVFGCTNNDAPVSTAQDQQIIGNDVSDNRNSISEANILDLNNQIWSKFAGRDELSLNFKRRAYSFWRTLPFKRAFISFWFVNDKFPEGENSRDVIIKLNERKLIPFWPLDPATRYPMIIVDDPSLVLSWQDIFIEEAENGTFDYILELRHGLEPYNTYVDEVLASESLDNLQHQINLNEYGIDEPVKNPAIESDAFRDMTMAWFMQLLKASFKESGGTVPATLAELLKGKVAINTDSWGHPAGGVEDGMPGDFEFGVDPVENGYYIYNVDSNGNSHDIEFIFYKSEINGDMIYDLRSEDHYIQRVFHQLKNRIPLLSDESFSEPFDFSGYQTVTLADVIGPDMVSQNTEVSSGGIQSD